MEKLKAKHDHKLTDIVKVAIFSLFLLLPLLIFAPSALYYGFNEHAKVPEETNVIYNYKYESNEIININDINTNNIYLENEFNFNENNLDINFKFLIYNVEEINTDTSIFNETWYSEINFIKQDYTRLEIQNDNDGYLYFRYFISSNLDSFNFYTYDYEINEDFEIKFSNCIFSVENEYFNDSISWLQTYGNLPEYTNYNVLESVTVETDETPTISTKMYKSWQDVWTQPVFNWTGNTNFAATINAMNLVFGINEQSYITNYLTYILTLTAVYIIFDIVLTLFTKLTHMFNGE